MSLLDLSLWVISCVSASSMSCYLGTSCHDMGRHEFNIQ